MKCDLGFKNQIAALPGGEQINACFLCGTCTASCPVSRLDGAFSPAGIMRLVLLGGEGALLTGKEIWQCVQCHNCNARCPQDARPADVIACLRQLALDTGAVPPETLEMIYKVDDSMMLERQDRIKEMLAEMGIK